MFKVEVGKGPLMFVSCSRLLKEIDENIKLEEDKNSFYAILYDFGNPIGCGRLNILGDCYKIDYLHILKEFYRDDLYEDIITQLKRKADSLNLKEGN